MRWWQTVLVVLGLLGHLVVGFFAFTSGLIAPFWAVIVFILLWTAASVWIASAVRRRWWVALVAPVGTALVMAGVLFLGDHVLGWTA
jgi:hypothetical protein